MRWLTQAIHRSPATATVTIDVLSQVLLDRGERMRQAAFAGTVRIQRYAKTQIDIEADTPDGGFLALNDVWHPWWRAEVDGRPTDILKANVLFRASQIGPGLHRVHFAFEPLQGAWEELKEKVAGAETR